MKKNCYPTALFLALILFSAIGSADDQDQPVVISPIKQETFGMDVTQVATNDTWLAMGYGDSILVLNKESGEILGTLLVSQGTTGFYLGPTWNMTLTSDDILVAEAYQHVIAAFDLKHLLPPIERPNGENKYTSLPNWSVDGTAEFNKFARGVAVNEYRRLVAVAHQDGVVVYKMFGPEDPIQQLFTDGECGSIHALGDFLAIGHGDGVSLYKYSEVSEEYEHVREFQSIYQEMNPGYDSYGRNGVGLSLSDLGELILTVMDGSQTDVRVMSSVTLSVSDRFLIPYQGLGLLNHVQGELGIIANTKVVHLPSGEIIGTFDNSDVEWYSVDYDFHIEYTMSGIKLYKVENIRPKEGNTIATISVYLEPVFQIKFPNSPPDGSVRIIGSPKAFTGGAIKFAVTANRGNKIGLLKYVAEHAKKIRAAKNKGGWIFELTNMTRDVLVQADFMPMSSADKKKLVLVRTENPIYILGMSEKKAKTKNKLLSGSYLGWDNFGFDYSIDVSETGADVVKYKRGNRIPALANRSIMTTQRRPKPVTTFPARYWNAEPSWR